MTRHHSRPDAAHDPHPAGVVRVMTRNVYVGALFDGILAAPTRDALAERVERAWRAVIESSFPERAAVLARDTARAAPDVIALQEVARLAVRAPDARREELVQDYLDTFVAALASLGLDFRAVSTCQAADVELPARDGTLVRLTVRNVLLARVGVSVSRPASGCFGVNVSARAGGEQGVPITVLRGWAAADVEVGERVLRVVNAHLETQPTPAVQRAQCEELLGVLGAERMPLVLMGDLNSDALGADTPTYAMLIAAGFTDAWTAARSDPGLTCCQDPDLRNPTPAFTKRIDHVLVRGDVRVLSADLVGADPDSRTPGGLWASDHAGVVAAIGIRNQGLERTAASHP